MLDVGNDFGYNRSRDGKGITDIVACFGIDCRVDADEFAIDVHEGATRVAGVDGGIGLYIALNAHCAATGCRPHAAGFGADNAGGNG